MTQVIILGGRGMLGAMLVDVLERETDLEITATVRNVADLSWCRQRIPSVRWELLDVDTNSLQEIFVGQDWVINAIGVTKPHIREDDLASVKRAIYINSLFPYRVAEAASESGAQVLQIATDCVYSGTHGRYSELSAHDPQDVYGKTKSLGEVLNENFHNLRCSVVGPEVKRSTFLLEWLRAQPQGAIVTGFANQSWNGLSTLHFARVCGGIISAGITPPPLQHLVPAGTVTKAELLETFAEAYDRPDIRIHRLDAPVSIDRTLVSSDVQTNQKLWRLAGYVEPPTVTKMVLEMSSYHFRLGNHA